MTFNLHVPADGWVSEEMHSRANSLIDSNISDVGSTILPSTREFDISPSTGTIAPQGELDIKVHVIRTFLYIKYQSSSCYLGCPLGSVIERSTIFNVEDLHYAGSIQVSSVSSRIFRMTPKPLGMGTLGVKMKNNS